MRTTQMSTDNRQHWLLLGCAASCLVMFAGPAAAASLNVSTNLGKATANVSLGNGGTPSVSANIGTGGTGATSTNASANATLGSSPSVTGSANVGLGGTTGNA